ncbi:HPr family phosphocarrier protein [Lacrimispora sp. JR3]|uniref:HPr family phosphocarrier protein n=1 Tax=Lacrimispora sinapis TaxID=3111456 RepID=UPI0037484FFE
MKKYPIQINNIEDITKFVRTVTKYNYDVDLCKGNVVIDAKSILGIMTICPNPELEMIIYSNEHDDILESLSDFLREEKTA